MPTFPKYHGEMPKCLNPLKPHHWFLLLSWVHFQPFGLKYHVFQAAPELYRDALWPWKAIFRTWRTLAYRNLYVTAVIAMVVISVLIGLPYTLLTGWMLDEPVNLWLWVLGVVRGMAIGMAIGMVSALEGGVEGSVSLGVSLGVILGVALGAEFGITGGVIVNWVLIFMAIGVFFRLATGGDMRGMAFGVALGIVYSVAGCVVAAVDHGGAAMAVSGMIVGVPIWVGALHLIFYPFQFVLALCYRFHGVRHPLEWDQSVVLPLPNSSAMLAQKLSKDEQEGFYKVAVTGRNPFQRWVMQKVFSRYLHNSPNPLAFLYELLTNPDLTECVNEPDPIVWKGDTPFRHLLFGELALKYVKRNIRFSDGLPERLVWRLTLPLRERQRTPLTDFAGMICDLLKAETFFAENFYYSDEEILEDLSDEESIKTETLFARKINDLLDEEIFEMETFDFSVYANVYNNLSTYPGGEEISWSFATIADFLSYHSLEELAEPAENKAYPTFNDPIRPAVLATLDRLKQVRAEIATYRDSTNRMNQQAVLLRAADALKNLSEYVSAEVITPEQYLLQRIILQWWVLVTEEGGEDPGQA